MLRPRLIPALLLREASLVKTRRFGRFTYIGDPCNTVRIFNELEMDELLFLDILASRERRGPNLSVLADIANECFMPVGYGGGIRSFADAMAVFETGFEKVAVNTAALARPALVTEIADHYGSQAVVGSIDIRRSWGGRPRVVATCGTTRTGRDPIEWAQELEHRGAGELLVTAIDREGTWSGFDVDMVSKIAGAVSIPVIAHGGCGSRDDADAVVAAGASAVAVGSLVVFQRKGMGVLVNRPWPDQLWGTQP